MIEVRDRAGSVSFSVRVQPGARQTEIVGEWQGALRIRLAAPPVDGLANEALRRWLAEHLNVPLGAVKIAHGQRSRSKRVEIVGATGAQVRALLLPGDARKPAKS